ncbi:ly6/PLAUR domain-containing protein 3 [Mixophyes fleayi]|uniref:ly6/PLAUR domain-containing protein 3 n=1 Tax=Mixophyes fleayi TaxID=3061075 RepID=UPI003F4DB74D
MVGTRIILSGGQTAPRMKWISRLAWRGFTITIIYLISTTGLKGVQSQPIDCYTCTDQGDGGCSPENAVNVTCPPDHNVCLEVISAIKTSHDQHIILKKGCAMGDSTKLDETISFHGMSIFIQINQCNSSLCNTNMDLKKYPLAPADNTTHVPNNEQCYSCIGKDKVDCLPFNPPVMDCYDIYTNCFDGNITVSIGNDTTIIPIKSCSIRYRCAVQTLTMGGVNFEIKGACCSGGLCNQDLSNKIQLGDLPFLVRLNKNKEELTVTNAPPPWLPYTRAATPTRHHDKR